MLKTSSKRAFSLIEIMVAIAVILIGLAGVTSALVFGIGSSRHGENVVDATNYGRAILEACYGRNYINDAAAGADNMPDTDSGLNDAAAERRAITDAPFDAVDVHFGNNRDRFSRNVTCVRRPGADGEYLALVTVRIYWFDDEVERSVTIQGVVPHARDS